MAVVICVVALGVLHWLMTLLAAAQHARDIRGGFDFLLQPAGFRISESLLSVEPEDSALRAIAAGLVNTLSIAACALPLASVLGLGLGLLRLTRHPLLARVSLCLTVPIRNTPVLLQLFAWYGAFLALPGVRQAWQPVAGVFVSNRGLTVPWIVGAMPYLLALGAMLCLKWAVSRGRVGGGAVRRAITGGIAAILLYAVHAVGVPLPGVELPVLRGFGMQGGLTMSPERSALLLGLAVFHAAYMADIVVAAVRGVPLAQWHAGLALGLRPVQNARWILYPHAARAGVPPYANQCAALIKNSALGVAIGYPDLMGVLGSVTAQTARALECLSIAALIYLALGFLIGAAANGYNTRVNANAHNDQGGRTLGDVLALAPLSRQALAGKPSRLVITLVLSLSIGIGVGRLLQWSVFDAIWLESPAQCQLAAGACWAAVRENAALLTFGTLAEPVRWRAAIVIVVLLAGIAPALAGVRPPILWAAPALFGAVIAALALGGAGLAPAIPVTSWSGVLVTVILAISAIACALPGGLALALLRRSRYRVLGWLSTVLIEGVRGVPLVTQLLLVAYLVPFIVGGDWSGRKFALAWITLSLHTACLLAEVLRGGFQAVSDGQPLAARALGLTESRILWHITLPQAARHAAAPAIGVIVGAVKDTSLVTVIGLFDVLSAAKAVLADGTWRPDFIEIYAVVAGLYFVACVSLSCCARRAGGRPS